MLAFGSDFQFENANINFKNMDKLMRYINAHPEYELNMFYSTPSIYIEVYYRYIDVCMRYLVKRCS
jgi:lysosomal alpha-mannosidase